MRTAGTSKSRPKINIKTKRPIPHITNFIPLYGCHLDYGILRVRTGKRWMFRCQRKNGSLHRCILTKSSFLLALLRNRLTILKIYYYLYLTQKLPWSRGSLTLLRKQLITWAMLFAQAAETLWPIRPMPSKNWQLQRCSQIKAIFRPL